MIAVCPENALDLQWVSENIPDSEHAARTFLQGERSLAGIQGDPSLQEMLDSFLNASGEEPLLVSTAGTGELLLRSATSDACLLLDGRTADVLTEYLSGNRVTIQDRMDMTVRSSRRLD